MNRTGGGGPLPPLLPVEEKLMGIIGWTVVEGDATSELGFVSIFMFIYIYRFFPVFIDFFGKSKYLKALSIFKVFKLQYTYIKMVKYNIKLIIYITYTYCKVRISLI